MDWKPHADRLASVVTPVVSRWRPAIAAVPRHLFAPRWWTWAAPGAGFYIDTWELRDGPADPAGWMHAAYSDRSMVTQVASERLDGIGLHPALMTCDATGPLPGTYDRIVATVAVRPIPASWLAALRPGGRLVTSITGTSLIVTAGKTPDGGAAGRTEWDRAGFMDTRSGPDYPPGLLEQFAAVRDAEGESVTTGRYPVVKVTEAWELYSTLGVTAPGIQHHYTESGDGQRTAWMLHPDGSWARAAGNGDDPPAVHQGGPRRLWDILDEIRRTWLRDGSLPAYGARVTITPDGTIQLKRGRWQASIPQPG